MRLVRGYMFAYDAYTGDGGSDGHYHSRFVMVGWDDGGYHRIKPKGKRRYPCKDK